MAKTSERKSGGHMDDFERSVRLKQTADRLGVSMFDLEYYFEHGKHRTKQKNLKKETK